MLTWWSSSRRRHAPVKPTSRPSRQPEPQAMDDTKHKKRDKKHTRVKKHGDRGGIDDPQQALGLLRAHLEDIRNACGVYTGWSCPTCWSAVKRCWHSMRRSRFGRQWSRRQKALEHLRNP